MQISLAFFKRLLLSVVFLTANSVYATEPRAIPVSEASAGLVSETPITEVQCVGASSGSSDDDKDKANCQNAQNIRNQTNHYIELTTKNAPQIKATAEKFQTNWVSCIKGHSRAAMACLENLNENITSVTKAGGLIAAMGNGVTATNGSCDKIASFMDMANKALTVYNSACGLAQGMCSRTCGVAVDALTELQKQVGSDSCIPGGTCQEPDRAQRASSLIELAKKEGSNDTNKVTTAGKRSLCKSKYADLLLAGAAGLLSVIATLKSSKECEQETAAASMDCTLPENAQTPTCLCQANPRLQGCANSLEKAGDASTFAGMNSNGASITKTDPSELNLDGGGPEGIERDPASASGSGMPAGGGGGSGIGGGSGLSPSSAAAGASGRRGLDTNILAGGAGGGGGGGWGRSGSGSANSKLGAYLPGGAKDPALGGNAWASEVTGQGGKSNWEKVRDRYQDNKPSLLNN